MKSNLSIIIFSASILLSVFIKDYAIAIEPPKADKNSCPFSQSVNAMQTLKEEMTKFSFQLLDQGSQAKNSLCQNYMNTLNTARTAYTSIIKTKSLTNTVRTANGDLSTPSTVSQQELASLNAQIQMSDAMQGLMGSGCQVDDQNAVSSATLQLIDSIAGTITLAGLIDPKFLLVGVSLSAISRLGVTLANWLLPKKETTRDRLSEDLKNSAFLDRLCIFRSMAYKVDEINPGTIDLPRQKQKVLEQLSLTEVRLYDHQGMRCFMKLDDALGGYQKLGLELREILSQSQVKPAAEKCSNYKYALEEQGKTTNRYRISHLYDLVWRIGCDDISIPDEATPTASPSPMLTSTLSSPPAYPSQRVADYCRNWRKLLDTVNHVDCFGTDTKAVDSFNSTAQYLFDTAAIVGEESLRQLAAEDPDMFKSYLQLKNQRELLLAETQRLNEISLDQSNSVVQIEGMLTNLGNLILGDGLTQYAHWNSKEIQRNMDESRSKIESVEDGTITEKCSAGQFVVQRIRQIEPRVQSLNKVCEYMGGNGKQPKPSFVDKTRTFSSITDLQESPLDIICTPQYLQSPRELPGLKKAANELIKACASAFR